MIGTLFTIPQKTFNGNNAEHNIELHLYGWLYNLMDNYYNNTTMQYTTIYIYWL